MMRNPILSVAALVGLAVSAPAQLSIEARVGRHIVQSAVVRADVHHDHGRHTSQPHRHAEPRYRMVRERVLVEPGYWREEHVPPTYGWVIDACGHRHWGVVTPASCRRVWVPARYEWRVRRVRC
jgi:hypothetical protein